jgi:hypothetical protein
MFLLNANSSLFLLVLYQIPSRVYVGMRIISLSSAGVFNKETYNFNLHAINFLFELYSSG